MTLPRHLRDRVSRWTAMALFLGGLLNKWSGHEWAFVRPTDLYSWCPGSSTYRAFVIDAWVVMPQQRKKTWHDGDLFDSVPAVVVGSRDAGKKLIARIKEGNDDPKPLHNLSTAELRVSRLVVSVQAEDDDAAKPGWWDYVTSTEPPRVSARVYQNRQALERILDPRLTKPRPPQDSNYLRSPLYYVLMCVPIVFLFFDVRLFFHKNPKTSLSAREALFRPYTSPTSVLVKRYIADVYCEVVCLQTTASVVFNNTGASLGYNKMSVLVVVVALLDSWVLSAQQQRKKQQSSSSSRFTATTALLFSCAIKIAAVGGATIYVYRRELTRRYTTMSLVLPVQIMVANLAAALLSVGYGNDHHYDTLEAAFTKLVMSQHMYTAACTKLGEAGLGWIDDRYLAQLAMRGVFRGKPCPLSGLILGMPAFVRAAGMGIVLVMECTAVFSWWNYETFFCVWLCFMVGSTLSIGVPLDPLLPLLPYTSWWGVVAGCLLFYQFIKWGDKNYATMVRDAQNCGTIPALLWNNIRKTKQKQEGDID